jgi:hypothetical protein
MSHYHTNLEILSQSNMGHVGVCLDCGNIQVSYGNVLLYFTERSLRKFVKSIKNVDPSFVFKMPEGDRILITSPCKSVMMTLDDDELNDIVFLIEDSIITLEINKVVLQ